MRHTRVIIFAAALVFWAYISTADAACTHLHESQNICGSLCEPTCQNPHPNSLTCPRIVCTNGTTAGCRCDDGYLRNTANGQCVLQKDCP